MPYFLSARWVMPLILLFLISCSDNSITREGDEEQLQMPNNDFTCVDGLADAKYPCNNIDLISNLTPAELQGERLNDIWGWTDPETGTEYALVGLTDGVTFVDLSEPSDPMVVGKLDETASVSGSKSKSDRESQLFHEEHDDKSAWRDFKVYNNYLYVVSDNQAHGLQVFDLKRLREVNNPPAEFSEDLLYEEFENAHNIAINEEEGFAYIVGSNTFGGGLHIIDVNKPQQPEFVGSHSDPTVGHNSTGYVHDTQCVTYHGSDTDYQGDEICMNASETHLAIVNVTDKEDIETLATAEYEGSSYAHQGWFTDDHQYFLLDDELDEQRNNTNTHTYIWDVRDLDQPKLTGIHESPYASIDHNQYVNGNFVYQANYTSGLRILSLQNIVNGKLEEVAGFDSFPKNNDAEFDGAWSNYPFFESGLVIVSDISNGLFVLKPKL